MTDLEDRISRLCGRASRSAWSTLQQLRDHPQFPKLLVHLEKVDRTLLESDIEQALRFLMQHPDEN